MTDDDDDPKDLEQRGPTTSFYAADDPRRAEEEFPPGRATVDADDPDTGLIRRRKRRVLFALVLLLLATPLAVLPFLVAEPQPLDYLWLKAKDLDFDRVAIEHYVEGLTEDDYAGALRGPVGTLWHGGGNGADRAWLRTELLRLSGYGVDHEAPVGPVLRVMVRTAYADGEPDELAWELPTTELAGSDLLLSYREVDGAPRSVLRFAGESRVADDRPADAARQDLVFRFAGEEWRRELFTAEYRDEGYANRYHRDNRHLVRLTTGFVAANVLQVERARIEAEAAAAGDDDTDLAATHRLRLYSYRFLDESDRAARAMAEDFAVAPRFHRPRILIFSEEFEERGERTLAHVAIDLRRDAIDATGERAHEFHVARAQYEIGLEAGILRAVTGKKPLTAPDVFAQLRRPWRPTPRTRIAEYRHLLVRLHAESPEGSRFRIALADGDRIVAVRRRADGGLAAEPLPGGEGSLARDEFADSPLRADEGFVPEDFDAAARHLDALCAFAGAPVDYRPAIRYEEPERDLFIENGRIFFYSPHGDGEAKTWEIQFSRLEPDVVLEGYDHWQAGAPRNPPSRLPEFTVDGEALEKSHHFSTWYHRGRPEDVLVAFFGRDMYRELDERGRTDFRYGRHDYSLTEPIRLFVKERTRKTILVNNREREVPVMVLEGTWAADAGEEIEPDGYEPIVVEHDGDTNTVNRWVILDHPRFPFSLGSLERIVRIQTRLPVRVVDAATGEGVGGAAVSLLAPGERLTSETWPDGRAWLPVLKQPFGKFPVRVAAPGYREWSGEVDLNQEGAIPIEVELERAPPDLGDEVMWITADNLDAEIGKLEGRRHTADAVRDTLEGGGNLAVMIPKEPVAMAGGPTHAWYVHDLDTGHFTAVTEDLLHGSTRQTMAEGVAFLHGFFVPWWGYAAGRLDAIELEVFHGAEFQDGGHRHAMAWARRLSEDTVEIMKQTFGRASGAGYDGAAIVESFERGTRAGLAFLDAYFGAQVPGRREEE